VDRSGLVAGYVGQTALKTAKKIEEAKGGVLFIDEAYALARKDDTFGQESIDTILKAMEDNRDDFVVIVAGYTKPMENFINSNPGLKSRFNKYIEFPDYTIDELMGIFDMNCKKYDYEAEEDVKAQIRAMIVQRKLATRENFANAREVRNLFEEIITNQARRVAAMDNPGRDDMKKIMIEDLTETARSDAEKTIKKAADMTGKAADRDSGKPDGAQAEETPAGEQAGDNPGEKAGETAKPSEAAEKEPEKPVDIVEETGTENTAARE
jgi:SpoVK/Ycf46/Vps4 family AAA+-type ATPase